MPTETDLIRAFRKEVVGKFIKITPGPWGNTGEPDLIGSIYRKTTSEHTPVVIEAKKGVLRQCESLPDRWFAVLERQLTPLQMKTLAAWQGDTCFTAYVLILCNWRGKRKYVMAPFTNYNPGDHWHTYQELLENDDPVIWL